MGAYKMYEKFSGLAFSGLASLTKQATIILSYFLCNSADRFGHNWAHIILTETSQTV